MEQVTELYDLNRKYDEWKEGLKIYVNNNVVEKLVSENTNEVVEGDYEMLMLSLIHI